MYLIIQVSIFELLKQIPNHQIHLGDSFSNLKINLKVMEKVKFLTYYNISKRSWNHDNLSDKKLNVPQPNKWELQNQCLRLSKTELKFNKILKISF